MMDEDRFDAPRQSSRETRRLADLDDYFSSTENPASPLVMVIDDSLAVRRVVEISLQRVGISSRSYADGLEALLALQDGEVTPPRILLLDIGLPRMSGYELARLFRSNPAFQQTRIIMLSGHDGVVNRAMSRLSGASDFIAKPFRSKEFVGRIRTALSRLDWQEN